MTLLVAGINHRTAPLALREKLYLGGDMLATNLRQLASQHMPEKFNESAILSTCNRLEIYGVGEVEDIKRQVCTCLARLQGIDEATLAQHLYIYTDEVAAQHLMKVACGLDSLILGEQQILGQVNTAYQLAHKMGNTGPILNQLFIQAIHAGKRAHTETHISRHTTSISHAAAQLIAQHVELQSARILLIGAGDMARLAGKALAGRNAKHITIINRTYERAIALAEHIGGIAKPYMALQESAMQADVILTATGAPHIILTQADIQRLVGKRGGKPLLLVDIAVPRNIEKLTASLPNVTQYDIDDLKHVVDEHREQREAAIPQVEGIISEELATYTAWLQSRAVVPILKDLREHLTTLAKQEVRQALSKLGDVDEREQQVIERMAHRLVNKILHEPTTRLKSHAVDGNGDYYAQAVRELFALDNK